MRAFKKIIKDFYLINFILNPPPFSPGERGARGVSFQG
jgi:hypothetical protein